MMRETMHLKMLITGRGGGNPLYFFNIRISWLWGDTLLSMNARLIWGSFPAKTQTVRYTKTAMRLQETIKAFNFGRFYRAQKLAYRTDRYLF